MDHISHLNERLGRALRVEITRRDLRITDVATQAGMGRGTLTRHLRGKSATTVEQLVRITAAIGVTPCSVIHAALKDTPCKS